MSLEDSYREYEQKETFEDRSLEEIEAKSTK
ncbi:hypothetical protein WG8_0384 [Paenibacillus sp. Aloe-11]|nr:hypothetical protein WG8_0384 [Paenibacillus sp. Aloe-11]